MTPKYFANDLIDKETYKYFQFITHPHNLKFSCSMKSRLKSEKSSFNTIFLDSLEKRNLQCFKLIGEKDDSLWEIYYVDLETPLIFYPITDNIIDKQKFRYFSLLGKTIKSNLLTNLAQDAELLIISLDSSRKGSSANFIIYKLEDQVGLTIYDSKTKNGNLSNKRSKIDQSTAESKSKLLVLKKGKKKMPFGRRNTNNRLNLLTGREWLKFSKTWFIHRPPRRDKEEILHPAKFPETMIRQFITFFTKPGELILDPFLGSGSTLIAAKKSNRSGIGIELSSYYAEISKQRLKNLGIPAYPPIYQTNDSSYWEVFCDDSRNLLELWSKHDFPLVDFCISSPPYWNQLERDNIRQKERKEQGLDTKYSIEDEYDLGNVKGYQNFLNEQKKIFNQVSKLLKPKGYLVIITNNVFAKGQLYPLTYDTAISLTRDNDHKWILKDEKVWLQDDKALIALGVNYAWVGNRCHQYCLIFRKESKG